MMRNLLKDLTIITLVYNDFSSFKKTYENLNKFRDLNGTHLIINCGESLSIPIDGLVELKNIGLYQALNIGISMVRTEYFMFLHSGDTCSDSEFEELNSIVFSLTRDNVDLFIGSARINYALIDRFYNATKWHPWMIKYGIQPPHVSCIYKSAIFKSISYDCNHRIISDFLFFERLFRTNKNLVYTTSKVILVSMASGGKSTNGFYSFLNITKEMIKAKNYLFGLSTILPRLLFKLFQVRLGNKLFINFFI